MKKSITVTSSARTEAINITDRIAEELGEVEHGLLVASIPHTTAAIYIAEDDAELREDYLKVAESGLAELRPFKHIRKNNPNTEAHVYSSLFGTSVTVVVENGKLSLGTYQNVMFLEMDGPKERTVELNLFREPG